ncbi:hypothetical protein [Dongia sp.]|uniref:hypothetical protein n=1 Tax=Dongia sp. TaxID=1977262 RepID=UPI0037524216
MPWPTTKLEAFNEAVRKAHQKYGPYLPINIRMFLHSEAWFLGLNPETKGLPDDLHFDPREDEAEKMDEMTFDTIDELNSRRMEQGLPMLY